MLTTRHYGLVDADGFITQSTSREEDPDAEPAPFAGGRDYRLLPGPINWLDKPTPTARLRYTGSDVAAQWVETENLADAQDQAWEQVKAARAAAELAPFAFDGGMYDVDTARISGAALNALMAQLAGVPFSIDWTLADNTVRTLDGAQMQALGVALAHHIGTAFATARAMREAIAAAPSPAAAYEAAAWPQS